MSLLLKNDRLGIWWAKDKCVHHFSPGAFKKSFQFKKTNKSYCMRAGQAGGSSLKDPQPAVPAPQRGINQSGLTTPDNLFLQANFIPQGERKICPAPENEMKTERSELKFPAASCGRSSRPDQEGVKITISRRYFTPDGNISRNSEKTVRF